MCSRGEGAACDFCQESGYGPDADSGQAGQDRVKRVSPTFYLKCDLLSLFAQRGELKCQSRQYNDSGIRTRNDDGLLSQCLGDVCSKACCPTRRELAELGCQLLLTERPQLFW